MVGHVESRNNNEIVKKIRVEGNRIGDRLKKGQMEIIQRRYESMRNR